MYFFPCTSFFYLAYRKQKHLLSEICLNSMFCFLVLKIKRELLILTEDLWDTIFCSQRVSLKQNIWRYIIPAAGGSIFQVLLVSLSFLPGSSWFIAVRSYSPYLTSPIKLQRLFQAVTRSQNWFEHTHTLFVTITITAGSRFWIVLEEHLLSLKTKP